ncbi:MAG: FKBP-type peptidyl-prolyl cis-trans isomerase [Methanomassiliicoccales archaeon]
MASQTESPSQDESAAIKEGDLIQLEIDGWITETGKLFMTTSTEKAKEAQIYNEKEVYQPIYEIAGKKRLYPGLENSILHAQVGQEVEVEIKPEEGPGLRDPSQVKLYSVHELERLEVEPRVGTDVVIGNRVGRITQATAGRVRIDFNNPLAGHVLKYRYKILRKIAEPEEKIRAFLEMYYGTATGFEINIADKELKVVIAETAKLDQRWGTAKLRVVADAFEYAGIEQVEFIEKYQKRTSTAQKPPEKKEESGSTAQQAPASDNNSKAEGEQAGRVA